MRVHCEAPASGQVPRPPYQTTTLKPPFPTPLQALAAAERLHKNIVAGAYCSGGGETVVQQQDFVAAANIPCGSSITLTVESAVQHVYSCDGTASEGLVAAGVALPSLCCMIRSMYVQKYICYTALHLRTCSYTYVRVTGLASY
jgi:hypothetical protein